MPIHQFMYDMYILDAMSIIFLDFVFQVSTWFTSMPETAQVMWTCHFQKVSQGFPPLHVAMGFTPGATITNMA